MSDDDQNLGRNASIVIRFSVGTARRQLLATGKTARYSFAPLFSTTVGVRSVKCAAFAE